MKHLRNAAFFILLLALCVRSAIPLGYMPEFSGASLITYCDGTDHSMMEMGKDPHAGHMGHHPMAAHTHMPCPYSMGALYGFTGVTSPVVLPPQYAFSTDIKPEAITPKGLSEQNKILPRAPPQFS